MSDSLERLREARFIEEVAADDEEIVGLWSKALESYGDSGARPLSRTGAFKLLYDAGRQAVMALVHAHGYRTKGTSAHHQAIFAAGAALAPESLSSLIKQLELQRGTRHDAEYSARREIGDEDVERVRTLVWAVINDTASVLRSLRPYLRSRIKKLR